MDSISVVIPTYNREKTMGYCLESVFRQTLKPLEIIVVDDCSTDNTIQTILQMNNPLVRVIKLEKNSGAQAARNRGILEAKGEWIAFQDSDDEWLQDKLEKQLGFAVKNKYEVAYTGGKLCLDGENKDYNIPEYSKDSYIKILTSPGPMFQGLLVKKVCLEKIGFLDENVPAYQEWDTFIRLARFYTLGFINEPLFTYHLHSGATISKDGKRDADGYNYIVHKHKQEIVNTASEEVYIKHLKVISEKYFRIHLIGKWREINKEIMTYDGLTCFNCSFKTLIMHISPAFYQRFSNQITPVFVIKRWFYLLRRKTGLT